MYLQNRIVAIIPAAGSGARMGSAQKKQYLALNGKEILNWTLIHLLHSQLIDEAVIVVPKSDVDTVRVKVLKWLDEGMIQTHVKVVEGGETRQESVYKGLIGIEGKADYVLIHDGVRPFVPNGQLKEFLNVLIDNINIDGVVAGMQATDTLKRINSDQLIIETVDREHIWSVQTPQIFPFELLINAHERARMDGIQVTDDAALLEVMEKNIKIIQSSPENIKITRPFDLLLADAIMKTYQMG